MQERVKYRIEKCTTNSIQVNIISQNTDNIIFKLRLNSTNIGESFSETQGNEELFEKHNWNGPASTPIKQMLKLSHIISDAIWLRATMENEMASPDKYLDYHQTGFHAKNLDVPRIMTITLEDDDIITKK